MTDNPQTEQEIADDAGAQSLAKEATLSAQSTLMGAVTETAPATDTASSGHNGRLQRIAQRITSLIALIPTSLGQKTMANSLAVVIASDQSTVPVSAPVASTATLTSVSASTSSVSLLALNTSRKGAIFYNESNSGCYMAFASTASASAFTIFIPAHDVFVMDKTVYTGAISGIWNVAVGAMKITELT